MPVLVVDVANVMGSRPDGWWRDRAGAASRLMAALVPLVAATVSGPTGLGGPGSQGPGSEGPGSEGKGSQPGSASVRTPDGAGGMQLTRIVAVIEGKARTAIAPAEIEVLLAPADGDSTIVTAAEDVLAAGETPLVITADRGLRDRLPVGTLVAGPRWLLDLL